MLRILNKYEHGYTVIPVMSALIKKGFFELFTENKKLCFNDLTDALDANTGYLAVSIKLLQVLSWVEFQDGVYSLTERASDRSFIVEGINELYHYSPNELILETKQHDLFTKWLNQATTSWGGNENLNLMLDGVILVPMMIGIIKNDLIDALKENDNQKLPLVQEIRDVFVSKKWAKWNEDQFTISGVGKFMLARFMITAVTASYRPMLNNIFGLMFDQGNVLKEVKGEHEGHIDRTLNVQGSGFQHEKYFKDVEKIIISIFNNAELPDQPDYIVDMGCGNGAFLKRIYDVVSNKTERGKILSENPITLIGLDFNEKALDEAKNNIGDLPCQLLFGDIGNPDGVIETLKNIGIQDPAKVLHVRSFLDHDRTYSLKDSGRSHWSRLPFESSGIDPIGNLISGDQMMADFSQHISNWSKIFEGQGIVILEVHAQTKWTMQHYFDTCEGLHFDALHAFSKQYLCEPEYYLAAMAQNGLFTSEYSKCYPKGFPYKRITLDNFQKKPFCVDFAHSQEKPILEAFSEALNENSWNQLDGLMDQYPELSFVMKGNGDELLAAVFCSSTPIDNGMVDINLERALLNEKISVDQVSAIMNFVVRYLTLKAGTRFLKGNTPSNLYEVLLKIGASSQNESDDFAIGQDFQCQIEN
jgi:SAM-dependent methyltransferase